MYKICLVTFFVISGICSAPTDNYYPHYPHPYSYRNQQYPDHNNNYPWRIMPRFNPYQIVPRYPEFPNYDYFGYRDEYRQIPRSDSTCGVSYKINQLIVNGEEFDEGTHPWLAAVFTLRGNVPTFICGGTLVSNKHIVTAAHCVKKNVSTVEAKNFLVVLGKCDIEKVSVNDNNVYKVAEVHAHPDYKVLSGDGDIAVLKLEEDLKFSDNIKPACLWSERNDLEEIVGLEGIVAGWGKTENGTASLHRPKALNIPIVSQETCLRSNAQFISVTSERTFCAGRRDGSGPCNGDSGSGLVMQRGGQWVLRGLVSLSLSSGVPVNRCDLSLYVVFTDISKFVDWLFTVIK